jgi:hypothetical protein
MNKLAQQHIMTEREGEDANLSEPPSSLDEIIATYAGEWVLLRVTAFDEDRFPTHGHVLAHGSSQKRVVHKLVKFAGEDREDSGAEYYLFSAFPRARPGEEVRQALREIDEEDYVDPFRWPR